jgi:hypothetical protein
MTMSRPRLSRDSGGSVPDQVDGIEYHVRRKYQASIILAVFSTVAIVGVIAVQPSGFARLACAVILANLLLWLYLLGPAVVATVRRDRLEVTNAMVTYVIPRARVVAVEDDSFGVKVRVESGRRITIGALSRTRNLPQPPSQKELAAQAGRLKAVLARATVDDHSEVTRKIRWANLLGVCLGMVGLLVLFYLSRNQ